MSGVDFLLLSGSPRGTASTSYSLLEYFGSKLQDFGKTNELSMAHALVRSDSEVLAFSQRLDEADYLILAAPLYVDSAPSHVIRLLTRVAALRQNTTQEKRPKFAVIVNSGFPERHHNDLAISIYKQFAEEANLDWVGGIPFGGGAIIGGTSLESSGGRGMNARVALDLLAKSLCEDTGIPEECIAKMNKLIVPKRLYLMMAHSGWKSMAAANNVKDQINDKPYAIAQS